jgi:DNA-binding response OmpR family regulator
MQPTAPANCERVLLVDDRPANLQILAAALEAEGYELLVAESGEEALATARQAQPQLILLDINMPGMDGYETCLRLKADRKTADSVVIFLSARGDVADKVQGLEVGAVDYVEKPFQFEEVIARVRKHLDIYRRHGQLQQDIQELRAQLTGAFRDLSEQDLGHLLSQGPGHRLVFKPTLRRNLETGRADRDVENANLQSVAALLNSDGGSMLVGVGSGGDVLGLERDDRFTEQALLLAWSGLVERHLGGDLSSVMRSQIRDLTDKRVLVVQCLSSGHPVYFRRDGDERFCIRIQSRTQSLKPSEVVSYLQQRQSRPGSTETSGNTQEPQFGAYTIDQRIGKGGMGVVYRGHHALLQRPTAIKLLDESRISHKTRARFEREVQLTSQLNHPNTIAIYDYGRTPEGIPYYVMEYLDGITLEELVHRHGPQPEGRVIRILSQLCGSLGEAHDVGLIHRDVKPANVMINRRGGLYDFVKLLDFGLVKALDATDEAAVTKPGAVTGTPLFLSPEAIEQAQKIDARSDLYSLGAVGYYLLAGEPMFQGHSIVHICKQQVNNRPVPPSKKRGEMIDFDLESLVLQCLAKNPRDRPDSAWDIQRELAACRAAAKWTDKLAAQWWQNEAT